MDRSIRKVAGFRFAALSALRVLVGVAFTSIAPASAGDLVVYWKLDEGSGTTAADSSGSAYDLGLLNGATWTSTTVAPVSFTNPAALDLDGANDLARDPNSTPLIDSLQDMTIAVWLNPRTLPGGIDRWVTLGPGSGATNDKAILRQESNQLRFLLRIDGTHRIVSSPSGTLQVGTWQHVAATYESATKTLLLYYNGSQVGSLVYAGSPAFVQAGLGVALGNNNSVNEGFDGYLDEVRIYNRALSASEVAVLGATTGGELNCLVETTGDGITDFASNDAAAVQSAMSSVPLNDPNTVIKLAGTCKGVQNVSGGNQTVRITKAATLRGGYSATSLAWSGAPDPNTNVTTLDANDAGRVAVVADPNGVSPGVVFEGLTLKNGTSGGNGGGVFTSSPGALRFTNCRLTDNDADLGGAIYQSAGAGVLTLTGSTLSSNSAGTLGGAIYVAGSGMQISGSTFSGNQVTHLDSIGGAIHQTGGAGAMSISASTLTGNVAGFAGGAVSLEGALLTITGSTFSNNQTSQSGSIGSALLVSSVSGGIDMSTSTVSGNSAPSNGPALYCQRTSQITNSTFSGNTGGGIVLAGGTLTMQYVTIAGNSGGPGLSRNSGTASIASSVVAGNAAGNCNGTITNGGSNVADDATCSGFTNADPLLGPLADNGGPTQTRALDATSPAVNLIPTGTNNCGTTITTDQRGFSRPEPGGTSCDAGAYEYHAPPTPTMTATPTETMTPTVTPTSTETGTATPTFTVTRTETSTPTLAATHTPTVTATQTVSATMTVTSTATETPTVTETSTVSGSSTSTPLVNLTPTGTATSPNPTSTPTPTATESGTGGTETPAGTTPTSTATPIAPVSSGGAPVQTGVITLLLAVALAGRGASRRRVHGSGRA